MKLFKAEVQFKRARRGRTGVEVLVHARTKTAARKLLAGKYTGGKVLGIADLGATEAKHFVLADLVR